MLNRWYASTQISFCRLIKVLFYLIRFQSGHAGRLRHDQRDSDRGYLSRWNEAGESMVINTSFGTPSPLPPSPPSLSQSGGGGGGGGSGDIDQILVKYYASTQNNWHYSCLSACLPLCLSLAEMNSLEKCTYLHDDT